ncbi:mono/diheme cytochrome c family protein [Deinobacterium chartae]|uniref:Mono/diheme cytochrome c family protein n=1 Tax=Deinobacterium chartae TaxID=521158 RepID=A0A841I1B2_9DEIO|nr:cytochrome c [Deinobacterium chartae]MBB6098189.1 mono/diheme cytochrome c family protein [Deinobacterium chartae]
MIPLLLLTAALIYAVLSPTLRPPRIALEDVHRRELEEERDLLLDALRELDSDLERGEIPAEEHARLRLRYTTQAARLIAALDDLSPAPAQAASPARPAAGLAAGATLAVVLLLGAAAFTVVPELQLLGVAPADAQRLRDVSRLPALEARAERTRSVADLRALADAAFNVERYDVAGPAYGEVLRQEPRDPQALRRFGFLLLDRPEYRQQALSLIQASVQAAPKDPEGQLLLGAALARSGQSQQALEALETFRRLAPERRDADALIAQLRDREGQAAGGAELFAQNCAACHGPGGEGGPGGPNLTGSPALRDPAALRAVITRGTGAMPAFPNLQGEALEALVRFVQGLGR